MDTTMDNPSFDLQVTHISFEEQRWLFKQRAVHKLDKLVNSITNLQKIIRGYQQFSQIPALLSSSSLVAEPSLHDQDLVYYELHSDGTKNAQINQFRLHHQQMFQLIFADLCKDANYRTFIMVIEGYVFYSSSSVKEYRSLLRHEMTKCLTSFPSFIQSRESKIKTMQSHLAKQSISSYQCVNIFNQKGLLFQLLPKIRYNITPATEYNSIMALGDYTNHTISYEELRLLDYTLNMKNKPILVPLTQRKSTTMTIPPAQAITIPFLFRRNGTMPINTQILHSLPIEYSYTENMVYGQKYPSFWSGNNYKNEKSNILFENIPVEKTSAEYLFIHRLFHQTVPENDLSIAFVERIENPHLWEKFCAHRSYMRRKNGDQNLNETWLFHGTKSENHHQIIAHGFNRSYCQDYVLYGRGVYFSRFAGYSCCYSDCKDVSFLFLCRVLVGHTTPGSNDIRVPPQIKTSDGKSIQADSTTDRKTPYDIACTFHDDQNYPEYIITFTQKTQ